MLHGREFRYRCILWLIYEEQHALLKEIRLINKKMCIIIFLAVSFLHKRLYLLHQMNTALKKKQQKNPHPATAGD